MATRTGVAREKHRQYMINYNKKHKRNAADKASYDTKYYAKNSTRIKSRVLAWVAKNIVQVTARKTAYRLKIKTKVIAYYSSNSLQCARCPERRLAALHIDHIDGNGRKHINLIKAKGNVFYAWLKSNNYPDGYQVLCANCNWLKYINSLVKPPSAYSMAIKSEFMNKLGGKCVSCKESNIHILTVHHINNDGAHHRRTLNNSGGTPFYKAILKNNDFSGLECRCFSCNDAEHGIS